MTLPNLSFAERQARAIAKRAALLAFLASGEVYTNAEIAAVLLGLSRTRACATLGALERDQAIKSEMHHVGGRQLRIFGVTPHGLAMADACGNPHFELGRTNPSWIQHRLDGQRMRLAAEAVGWHNWKPERVLRDTGLKKVPDAVATAPTGEVIAIEIERFAKTPKRYAELIVAYLLEIKSGKYSVVHFVSPPGIARLIENAVRKIDSVQFQGERVRLEDKHRARFEFHEFGTWPPVEKVMA